MGLTGSLGNHFLYLFSVFFFRLQFNPREPTVEQQQIVPPPPPGSPPPHLLQPKLKDPNKFNIAEQFIFFHYDSILHKMIVTPTPPHQMPPIMMAPPQIIKGVPLMPPIVEPTQPYIHKTNNNIRLHSDPKLSKLSASYKDSSTKNYHHHAHHHHPSASLSASSSSTPSQKIINNENIVLSSPSNANA